MELDEYGKLTYIIMNQNGMTAQAKLDMIYKASLLMGDKSWYNPENPTVTLTQERTIVEIPTQEQHSSKVE